MDVSGTISSLSQIALIAVALSSAMMAMMRAERLYVAYFVRKYFEPGMDQNARRGLRYKGRKRVAWFLYPAALVIGVASVLYAIAAYGDLKSLTPGILVGMAAFFIIGAVFLWYSSLYFRLVERDQKREAMTWIGRTLKHRIMINVGFAIVTFAAFLWKVIEAWMTFMGVGH
ncbi:hypothetical protein ACD578_25700 [Microvirga sp. RSM25]|uniref:hypothetical protein n=1 Tax=Microvirga sp. RSM25 TaxID=3273802 RepID=UPI00384C9154